MRIWDLSDRETKWKVVGHKSIVKGVCCSLTKDNLYFSCGTDKTVKIWNPDQSGEVSIDPWDLFTIIFCQIGLFFQYLTFILHL